MDARVLQRARALLAQTDGACTYVHMVHACCMRAATRGPACAVLAGSMTPWGTHMGGEEYEPDARVFWASDTPNSRVRDHAR